MILDTRDLPPKFLAPEVTSQARSYWYLKRCLDIVIASVALILLSPLMLVIALAVRLSSPGPVIYTQERVGLDRRRRAGPSLNSSDRRGRTGYGQPFRICKFRSMVQDAENGTGPVWATHRDPRATKVGDFLRRTHLDELPQLFNVLRGEMSIVGPRPERPEIVERLAVEIPGYRERSAMPPGITGLAQVKHSHDRDLRTVARKVLYDLYYIRNGGLLFDIKIMAATVAVMARADENE
jgi:lipopolysaccharide/colanic/teichoic acid biosynthesis glycosyltransferase